MAVTGSQNEKFTSNYANFYLKGGSMPHLPYRYIKMKEFNKKEKFSGNILAK